jgi:hypothetical protein
MPDQTWNQIQVPAPRDGVFTVRTGPAGVIVHPKSILMPPGDEPGAGGNALRSRYLPTGEKDTIPGESIEIGPSHIRINSVGTEIGIALVVGKYDDDIRTLIGKKGDAGE